MTNDYTRLTLGIIQKEAEKLDPTLRVLLGKDELWVCHKDRYIQLCLRGDELNYSLDAFVERVLKPMVSAVKAKG